MFKYNAGVKLLIAALLLFSLQPQEAKAEFITSSFVIGVAVGIITVEIASCYDNKEKDTPRNKKKFAL